MRLMIETSINADIIYDWMSMKQQTITWPSGD